MKQANGLRIPESVGDLRDPAATAVVIYDLQVGVVSQIATGQEIVARCCALIDEARSRGFRIFFTRHISLPEWAVGSTQLRRAMIWQRTGDPAKTMSPLLPTSPAAQLVPELGPQTDEVVIDKITMSAFEGTYLGIALRDLGISAIVIAGIALEIGIEPTVRHALDLNLIPIVLTDLCGSASDELRERSLATLRQTGEVMLTSSAEWLGAATHRSEPV